MMSVGRPVLVLFTKPWPTAIDSKKKHTALCSVFYSYDFFLVLKKEEKKKEKEAVLDSFSSVAKEIIVLAYIGVKENIG